MTPSSDDDGWGEELPDPMELFERMQRLEADSRADSLEADDRPQEPDDLPDPLELFRQMQVHESDASQTIGTDHYPAPEELFRNLQAEYLQAEQEEALLNFEMDPEPSPLPSPEELFRQFREEEEKKEQDRAPELPELPDLDALKAELEAEERARLDPDLLGELAGPERFVETVFDTIFIGEESRPHFELPTLPPSQDELDDEEPWSESTPTLESEGESGKVLSPLQPAAPPPPPVPAPPPVRAPRPVEPVASAPPASIPSPPVDEDRPSPTGTVQVDPDADFVDRPLIPMKKVARESEPEEPTSFIHRLAKATKKEHQPRFSREKLAIFTRQLSVMLKAGIQLHLALSFAAESDPKLEPILTEVMHKVESGYTLSAALSDTSRTFDPVYVGLIKAGEASGRLYDILERLADAMEQEIQMRKKIVSVMTYPIVLSVVSFMGTLGFIFFVLPILTPLFNELSVELPLPTKILLSMKDWLLPSVVIGALLLVVLYLMRDRLGDYIKSKPSLNRQLASVPFYIPIIGGVYDKIVTARVLYSLAIMLEVGITLGQALIRSGTSAGNALVTYQLERARADLVDGVGVTDCFRLNGLFNPSALHLIAAGEEAANLPEMFGFIAELFDEEVGHALDSASSVIEPLIMLVMGIVVGFVIIAAALPTIQLLQNF